MYRILVVEYNLTLREGIVYALRQAGYEPAGAGSVEEAGRCLNLLAIKQQKDSDIPNQTGNGGQGDGFSKNSYLEKGHSENAGADEDNNLDRGGF